MEAEFHLKLWYPLTELHDITTQKPTTEHSQPWQIDEYYIWNIVWYIFMLAEICWQQRRQLAVEYTEWIVEHGSVQTSSEPKEWSCRYKIARLRILK
jgi:hypothetical protein